MPYPFGTSDFFGRSRNAAAEFGARRVVVVAVNGEVMPSIFYQDTPLHRTRITLVPEHQPDAWEPAETAPDNFRRPLPALPRASAPARSRPLRGEILRDQEGRLYENIGGKIRPVDKLFLGPNGEILELVPLDGSNGGAAELEIDAQLTADAAADRATSQEQARPEDAHQPARSPDVPRNQPVEKPQAINREPTSYRRLFAEPGQKRIVRLGDFRAMLTPQLAHPERLRDAHRLPCFLQVYESTKVQPLTALAAALGGGFPSQLQLLTEPAARFLGLAGLPRSQPAVPPNFRRQPGVILPNERVFHLRLAHDPTADAPAADAPANPQVKATVSSTAQEQTPSAAAQRKNSIPERFVKPWEFKLTREAALYDMRAGATFAAAVAVLIRRFTHWIANPGELRKWQLMLRGKSLEDQLWGTPPPKAAFLQPKIRRWALETLENAGYEPHAMLLEWEIFWRRKGA